MLKITGLNEALAPLARAEKLNGKTVTPKDTFTTRFLSRHTKFLSFDRFCEAMGVKDEEGLAAIPSDELNRLVRAHTKYRDWAALRDAAAKEWLEKQIHRR